MSFRPSAPKPKSIAAPAAGSPRKKITVRFTDPQWEQLRTYCFHQKTTVQALVISTLADRLEIFDV